MAGPTRGPAPVLPSTGLHSYHYDSPPFSGATDLAEPSEMDLNNPRSPHGSSSLASLSSSIHEHLTSPPAAAPKPLAHSSSSSSSSAGTGPGIPVGRNSPPVDHLRQMSVQAQQQKVAAAASAAAAGSAIPNNVYQSAGSGTQSFQSSSSTINAQHYNNPTSPEPRRDSSDTTRPQDPDDALSTSRSRRLMSGYLFGSPIESSPLATFTTPRPPAPASSASFDNHSNGFDSTGVPYISYEDQLNGVGDGEADLDESAIQAEGGSEGFMRGEEEYVFPAHRLRRKMKDENKIPLVIVACGSFSPPTYLHLRMFEMAKDEIVESQTYEIMAGYYSPVSSYYKKAGLAPANDRVRMCELAVQHTSTWLMVDPWEAGQGEYQRTAVVLDHFDEMLNGQDGKGGVEMKDGGRRKYKIMLLAGGDLIESFGEPGVWSEPDLHEILGRFGCLIVERAGSDVWAFLLSHDILYHHRKNVIVIKQLIYNDISSTKVRLFVRRGMSIKYLLPNSVANYIMAQKLYLEPERGAHAAK